MPQILKLLTFLNGVPRKAPDSIAKRIDVTCVALLTDCLMKYRQAGRDGEEDSGEPGVRARHARLRVHMVRTRHGRNQGLVSPGWVVVIVWQIVSWPSCELKPCLKEHTKRITCMKLVNNKIWTCSMMNNIIIFDTKSRDAIRQILKLPDAVSAMEAVRASHELRCQE